MLSCYQEFVKVGISYIVNLEHIDSLNAQDMLFGYWKEHPFVSRFLSAIAGVVFQVLL